MKTHEFYIKRCIEIAKNGLGSTRPNPMVGSVIVHNNKIIGEGFTSSYGGNHAEVNAINSVKHKNLLKKATIYVTLEPCSHYGKTPPCSDLIIKHQIPNVVIGCLDDNILVAGKGIEKLKNAGCQVTVGVLENECKTHHKRFFTFHNKKRPYIILKWAETTDGFIAPETRNEQKPVWITNSYSRQLVHKWRAEEQAILVGTNTVLQDNPSLTTRNWTGEHPIRIVLDAKNKLPKDLAVFNNEARTISITKSDIDFSKQVAQQICELLHQENITSIIIEGGAKTLQTFIDENLWDEARIFTGNATFKNGTKAPEFSGRLISEKQIINDTLKIYTND
ncbi:bifunctional diaminohydroxyphosphoribosylaminopyrimidine deaminase/5-amino-6-(5-phosphoribosylamino)uracil reductase RibD [Aestuariibaculum sp. YM273]|uniref:bifunctional diaminohydroxyphosphoribosylaminopyrimidine deaminase/5-amino-6-(5-phosphoribosylamino)uracil reductase RibD n=1 Tax=Aestuariibaculum sp. YM273 TaxID=3070659 RepID=UPI0027DC4DF9|nr:bifunctional diaminohydroxyphosphoribosylaminopyrimidine deaminase/5-amino-6-(5-phosphoribosylamino)uracil reductase RibD [Aestuariibaculum sp. YM273]WMI65563.1 bifunctional diaminohydroxyphosphoribosylaminopyrimidine deaminase/5-amino-6-(5-phosphoribosylamino)uracil reductase RibD [Aestuariibaculum sp. YM273]